MLFSISAKWNLNAFFSEFELGLFRPFPEMITIHIQSPFHSIVRILITFTITGLVHHFSVFNTHSKSCHMILITYQCILLHVLFAGCIWCAIIGKKEVFDNRLFHVLLTACRQYWLNFLSVLCLISISSLLSNKASVSMTKDMMLNSVASIRTCFFSIYHWVLMSLLYTECEQSCYYKILSSSW